MNYQKETIAIDPESQQPIRATDVRSLEPTVERVNYILIPEALPAAVPPNEEDTKLACAAVGCVFSWIPIVGFVTFAVNTDAPRGSPRAAMANAACGIGTLVAAFNIIFWAFVLAS
jgi:hypothetical protein